LFTIPRFLASNGDRARGDQSGNSSERPLPRGTGGCSVEASSQMNKRTGGRWRFPCIGSLEAITGQADLSLFQILDIVPGRHLSLKFSDTNVLHAPAPKWAGEGVGGELSLGRSLSQGLSPPPGRAPTKLPPLSFQPDLEDPASRI